MTIKPFFILFFAISIVFAQEDSDAPKDTLQQSKVSTLSSNVLEKAVDSLKHCTR